MACTDGGVSYPDRTRIDNSPTLTSMQQRIDELAAELCRTQAFLYTLNKEGHIYTGLRQFHIGHSNELSRIIRKYKEHREHDKETALREAKKNFTELDNLRKKIEGLGGKMGEELATKLALAQAVVEAIPSTDPMVTDLY